MKYPGKRRQDWVLLEAIAAERRGEPEKARELYEILIEFNSESDPPYQPNAEAIAYAGRIAQVVGFNPGVIKDLKVRYDKARCLEQAAAQLTQDLGEVDRY